MTALFAHDHFFYRSDRRVWSRVGFSYALWERYLEVFEALRVLGREADPVEDGVVSSGLDVYFKLVPNPLNLRRVTALRETVRQIDHEVASSDVVIARVPSVIGSLAVRAAEATQTPYLIEVVGDAYDAYRNHGHIASRVVAPLMDRWTRRIAARAPYASYVTERYLQCTYPPGGDAVAASDVEIIRMPERVLENRLDRLPLPTGCPVRFGTIGSLTTRSKGLDVAMRALRRVRDVGWDVRYHVLGGGDATYWRDMATDLGIAEAVSFDGTLPGGEEVWHWLDTIDVYLQPSFQEGLPRALVEALSRGCPSFGSTTGGIPELIGSQFLHTPGDDRTLASQILRFLDTPEEHRAAAAAAFARGRDFDPDRLASLRRGLLEKLRDAARQPLPERVSR